MPLGAPYSDSNLGTNRANILALLLKRGNIRKGRRCGRFFRVLLSPKRMMGGTNTAARRAKATTQFKRSEMDLHTLREGARRRDAGRVFGEADHVTTRPSDSKLISGEPMRLLRQGEGWDYAATALLTWATFSTG